MSEMHQQLLSSLMFIQHRIAISSDPEATIQYKKEEMRIKVQLNGLYG